MDDVCVLIKEYITYDDLGNPAEMPDRREVFCKVYDVGRSEFYAAQTADMKPEITIVLSDYEDYEGEQLVEYNGELFSVIRTYRDRGSFRAGAGMSINAIELVLERKIGLTEEDISE